MKNILKKNRNIIFIIIILLLISFISCHNLFMSDFFYKGHDIKFHISRIMGIVDNLKNSSSPKIYFNYLNGAGYGSPLFYPDIFLYIPALLNYLGINLFLSYKIFIFLICFFSSLSMYVVVYKMSNNKKAAIISSFIYSFAPYRLTDIIIRAAIGEALAFIFMPIAIYGIYKLLNKDYKGFYLLTIGMTGTILSHLISSVILSSFLIIMLIIYFKNLITDKKIIIYIGISAIITLLLTSYFIFPMFEQFSTTNYLVNEKAKYISFSNKTILLENLIIKTNFNRYNPLCLEYIFTFFIILFIFNIKKVSKLTKLLFISGIIYTLITTDLIPWELFNDKLAFMQFPWRLFIMSTILLTIGSGMMIHEVNFKNKILVISIFLCIYSLVSCINEYKTGEKIYEPINYQISGAEYLPLKTDETKIKEKKYLVNTKYKIYNNYYDCKNYKLIKFDFNYWDNEIEVPILYYKGYKAEINEKEVEVFESDNGLLKIPIKSEYNKGTIKIYYNGTKLQKITKIISLITGIIFFTSMILNRKKSSFLN